VQEFMRGLFNNKEVRAAYSTTKKIARATRNYFRLSRGTRDLLVVAATTGAPLIRVEG
jgi:hypothetical protein